MNTTEKQLWKEYKETKDINIRNLFITQYLPLVKYVANRIINQIPPIVEHSDLINYGVFGLFDAIERFDLSKKTAFKTYAMTRIYGTIYDELRQLDWVPQSVKKKIKKLENAQFELENKLGRTPTTTELINYNKINIKDYYKITTSKNQIDIKPLDYLLNTTDYFETIQSPDNTRPDYIYEQKELRNTLIKAIDKLFETSRKILILHYYENIPFIKISQILNISISRISQIHLRSLHYLKTILTKKYPSYTKKDNE